MIKLTEWDLQCDPRPNGRGCLEGLAPSHQKQTSGEGESTSNLVLKQKKYCKFCLTASARSCTLLPLYTGRRSAVTSLPSGAAPTRTWPDLSLNLLPRGAGMLPGASLADIAGGFGLIILLCLLCRPAAPSFPNVASCCWIVFGLHFIDFFSVFVMSRIAFKVPASPDDISTTLST